MGAELGKTQLSHFSSLNLVTMSMALNSQTHAKEYPQRTFWQGGGEENRGLKLMRTLR